MRLCKEKIWANFMNYNLVMNYTTHAMLTMFVLSNTWRYDLLEAITLVLDVRALTLWLLIGGVVSLSWGLVTVGQGGVGQPLWSEWYGLTG